MLYNGNDKIVELNFGNGGTGYATWIDEMGLRLNNLPNGIYRLRAHLATEAHGVAGNPEADTMIVFSVNVSDAGICRVSLPLIGSISVGKKVAFSINASDKMAEISYLDASDRSPRWKRLCRDCSLYNKEFSFNDGRHPVSVRCINYEGETEIKDVDFFVDSQNPKISRMMPRSGTFTNGSRFSVKYSEDNVKFARLFWNPNVIKNDCPSGRNQECFFDVNLSLWNGQEINYWFEVEDVSGKKDISKIMRVKVDTSPPIIKDLDIGVSGRRVIFRVDINESTLERVEYLDENDRRPRWVRLCTKLNNGICEMTKNFRLGNHSVIVKAVDKAGNVDEERRMIIV